MNLLLQGLYDLDRSIFGTEPSYPWTAIVALAIIGWIVSYYSRPISEFPVVNDDRKAWTSFGVKRDYIKNAKKLLVEGHRKVIHFRGLGCAL